MVQREEPPTLTQSTSEMLEKTFGEQISDADLETVVAAISPHMSFRTPTTALNDFHDDRWLIEQLYYKHMINEKLCPPIAEFKASHQYQRVLAQLKACGHDDWVAEQISRDSDYSKSEQL